MYIFQYYHKIYAFFSTFLHCKQKDRIGLVNGATLDTDAELPSNRVININFYHFFQGG